ncbi:hypothetical protein FQN54_005339 [Arachnomyces sp. PD_36]|nr:hypothetical protein FQN54_005339 [Arachnomyces sp. PD_36]
MASKSLPSTPKASPQPEEAAMPSPGNWRHPQLKEIVKRQSAATFDYRNVRKIVWNGGALILTLFLGNIFHKYSLRLETLLPFGTYPDITLLVLRLFFLLNIATALYPLFRPKDDLSDIALTPSQRALLGLTPTDTPPATPGTTYVTPPRYRMSPGPRSGSPISRSTSPLSARGSQSSSRGPGSSSFSPSASPLLQKVVNGNRDGGRRASFGSQSPLSFGTGLRDSSVFRATPPASPIAGKGGSLNFSNKWLYEKSRSFSSSSGAF